ncbi:hypothetical protein [Lacticaseibacillus paracasei]|uniref:hypothetical protein n=1 Tax=Lacticaseibacillus paracasei TaxID=1597 RepID=UPI0038577693
MRYTKLKDITLFVKKTHITSFADLTYYAIEYSDDWFDVLANHNTLFLNKLIDSEWQKNLSNTQGERFWDTLYLD